VNQAFVLFIFFLQAGWLDLYLRSNGRSRFADRELFECVTAEVSPLAKSANPFDIAQGSCGRPHCRLLFCEFVFTEKKMLTK
jgi:hypothetical protein